MLRSALCAVALLMSATTVSSAQEWARKMFTVTSHDFGSVPRSAKVEYEFVLSNLYEEDVHISGVRSSCGCTSPRINKETLKTYEKGAIVAAFNTRTFLGQRSATVTVTIDKPFFAEVQLQVQGYIRSDVVLSPGAVELGSIDQGASAEKKIAINYAGRGTWRILEVKPASDYLETSLKETSRSTGQVSYDLTVRLKENAPLGYIKEQVMLRTNDQRGSEVPVDVEARVVSAITISPASLFLGAVHPGQKVSKQLVVQGKKPFKIVNITCADDCFKFQTNDASKAVHLVPLTFVAGDAAGKKTFKIRIETDLGDDAAQEITAYAQILAPASAAQREREPLTSSSATNQR